MAPNISKNRLRRRSSSGTATWSKGGTPNDPKWVNGGLMVVYWELVGFTGNLMGVTLW